MKKKIWFGVAAMAMLASIAYISFLSDSSSPSETGAPLRLAYVAAEGKVEALTGFDVDLGTGELNGRIAQILVKEGDTVHRGQVVASLVNEDLQAQVRQAEQELAVARARLVELEAGARTEEILEADASLRGATARMREASNELRRNRELHRQRLIPQSTLDAAEAAFKTARSVVDEAAQRKTLLEKGPKPETVRLYRDQVQLAEAALDYARMRLDKTIIRSPIDGTVIERYLDEGEGVTPEIPILAIADLGKLWINAEVDETDVGRIRLGDSARVTSNAYPGKTFKGSIREIADYAGVRKIRPRNPAANLGLKVLQVKIGMQEPTPLRLGMTVDVKITPGSSQGSD
jgi:ABC exporter DevB family membrane fusion protein